MLAQMPVKKKFYVFHIRLLTKSTALPLNRAFVLSCFM